MNQYKGRFIYVGHGSGTQRAQHGIFTIVEHVGCHYLEVALHSKPWQQYRWDHISDLEVHRAGRELNVSRVDANPELSWDLHFVADALPTTVALQEALEEALQHDRTNPELSRRCEPKYTYLLNSRFRDEGSPYGSEYEEHDIFRPRMPHFSRPTVLKNRRRARRFLARAAAAPNADRRRRTEQAVAEEAAELDRRIEEINQHQTTIDARLQQVADLERQLRGRRDELEREKVEKVERRGVLTERLRENVTMTEAEETTEEEETTSETESRCERCESSSEWSANEVVGERAPVRVEAADSVGEEGQLPPRPSPVRSPGRKRHFRDSSVSSDMSPVAGPSPPRRPRLFEPSTSVASSPSSSSCCPGSSLSPPVHQPVFSSSSSPSSVPVSPTHSVLSSSSSSSSDLPIIDLYPPPPPPPPPAPRRSQRIRRPPVRYQALDFRRGVRR